MGKTFQGYIGGVEKTINVDELISFGYNIDIVSEKSSSYFANVGFSDYPVEIEESTFEVLQKLYPNLEAKDE